MKPRIFLFLALAVMANVANAQEKGGCDLCGPSGTSQNQAKGNYSATVGMNNITIGANSMAVGQANKTAGAASVALGKFAWANATNAVVIGGGLDNNESKALINSYSGTLMVGFNSRKPTLFVSSSNGGVTTGKIGIGNMTSPLAKVHLLSDLNEDAGMILETSNKTSKSAFLQMYDDRHKITVSREGMKISAPDDALAIDAENIRMSGKVGINTDNNFYGDYDYALAVKGGILTSEVFVKEVDEWHDYVFSDDYKLMSLSDLESYICDNGHLPDLPSAEEVVGNGYNVAEMEGLLLKKIEELTLYTIELQRQLQQQQEIIERLNYGQRCLVFGYDANGNRTHRNVDNNCLETKEMAETQEIETDNEMKVYPNPTEGSFKIVMPGSSGSQKQYYKVYDMNGVTLLEGELHDNEADIDIGNYPSGVYLLKITYGDDVLSKIVLKH